MNARVEAIRCCDARPHCCPGPGSDRLVTPPESSRIRNLSPWAYWQLRLAAHDDDRATAQPQRARLDRSAVRSLLGPEPEAVALDCAITETVDCGSYERHRILYDSEAAMSVPAYLLIPHERKGAARGAAVLAVHGHGAGKSAICSADEDGDGYAHHYAERGFVVLAPDLRCFGERQDPQWDPSDSKYDCDWNLVCAVMVGVNPIAQNLWDLQRSIDVLEAHELVDPKRIAIAGLSYGATMSLLTAAMDTRISAVVASGFVSSWQAAHRVPWNMCGSQIMWGQIGEVEHADIAALIAPRPLLVETGTADPIFPIAAALATVRELGDAYERVGARTHLEHHVFDGGHRWSGERAYDFLAEKLMGPGA